MTDGSSIIVVAVIGGSLLTALDYIYNERDELTSILIAFPLSVISVGLYAYTINAIVDVEPHFSQLIEEKS